MNTVVSSAAATPSGSSCSTADFTQFPTKDVACAVGSIQGIPSNTSSILKLCCKTATVEQFNGNCGYYCLSIQQSVADLQKCFQSDGIAPGSIFCNSNNTATATAKPQTSISATASGTRTSGTSAPVGSTGAAPAVLAVQPLSKASLGTLVVVIVSAFAGTFL